MKQHTKTLGQVFLNDNNIIQKIMAFANPPKDIPIIEIGCGNGSLTKALAKCGNPIKVIEIDLRWLNEVKNLNLPNVTFTHSDVMKINFNEYKKSLVIANIPYQITSPLIEHFSKYKDQFKSLTIMIQKDVADRLLSKKNNKQFGSMTIFSNYHFSMTRGFPVSRNSFTPIPNVDSYVLKLTPKKSHFKPSDEALFFAMTRSFFWGRRKTMLNCLLNSPYITCNPKIRENQSLCRELSNRGETYDLEDHQVLFTKLIPFLTNSLI